MDSVLGKRKRRPAKAEHSASASSREHETQYQEALRRHFEAAFEPVESIITSTNTSRDSEQESDDIDDANSYTDLDSEWGGVSDTEEVQVVSYEGKQPDDPSEETMKSMRKEFMSSKPPIEQTAVHGSKGKMARKSNTDPKSAASLTAEDIALQRLLSESHLLSGSASTTLAPTLKARQAAQDLRLQSLGAKKPLNVLGAGNTPMAIRKGIENKRQTKERDRRRDAKESGIVLERETKSSEKRRMRLRDVGAPAVGKWRGGTLVLGKKDVSEIESQRLASDFGKRGKGKKGKRR